MWPRRRSVAAVPLLLLGLAADTACYDTGDGSDPPVKNFYFPVGLKVSHGGTVLYAINSDFDLQYNGGTLQSYDLRLIRQHTLLAIADPTNPALPLVRGATPGCPNDPPVFQTGTDFRQPLGETCAPPIDSTVYFRDSALVGAFATDLLLSEPPSRLTVQATKLHADDPAPPPGNSTYDRLFAPVRGNATLTWASVQRDTFESAPTPANTRDDYPPFRLRCGQDATGRCDAVHQVGENPDEEGNTRRITMPGEPFALSFSEDGSSIVITHQNETKTTLFSTGLSRFRNDSPDDRPFPAIQFVADQVPFGGVGITPIPHDPDAFLGASIPRPAFLETSRALAQVSLLRQYADEQGGVGATIPRPFLAVEAAFGVTASAGGTDSRGIVVDPTPRLACKARVAPVNAAAGRFEADRDREIAACARKPARAFIANRSPAALLVGDIGAVEGLEGAYDPDRLTIHSSVPLSAGASKVYLAPIVDRDGAYALRVFVVCFDSASLYIYDPDAAALENVVRLGAGPFAMAFDPFDLDEVARHVQVPIDPRDAATGLRRYRFAYVASFTQSFVQVLDLDNAVPNTPTFERVVFTLGHPTNPKGT